MVVLVRDDLEVECNSSHFDDDGRFILTDATVQIPEISFVNIYNLHDQCSFIHLVKWPAGKSYWWTENRFGKRF